jgi:hypothetical protein
MYLSPVLSLPSPLISKYFPEHPIIEHTRSIFVPETRSLALIQNPQKDIFYISTFK